jgi:hypothetical protein
VSACSGGEDSLMTAQGLRRFARPAEPRERPQEKQQQPQEQQPADMTERCELCAEPLGGRHGHIVDVETRSLQCACRACYLLFTQAGAASGRRRAVPERYLTDAGTELTQADWDALDIPVATAFFFHNSALERTVALYPSPAGATECLLNLEAWRQLAAAHRLIRELEPDIEAILVTTREDEQGGRHREMYLVPIDTCYELVGRLRLTWQGFDGGAEAHAALDDALAEVRRLSRPLLISQRGSGASLS